MKYILILLATISINAYAGTCEYLSDVANAIMTARQSGMSMKELWAIKAGKPLIPYAHAKIKEAYAIPRYSTYEYQQKEIDDFKNDAFLECVNVLNK